MNLRVDNAGSLTLVLWIFFIGLSLGNLALAQEVKWINPPSWLNSIQARRVQEAVEDDFEWTVRRGSVVFHKNEESYLKSHTLASPWSDAFVMKDSDAPVMHVSSHVTGSNFYGIYAHEWVHAVLAQKYKEAIPSWLEEGLANFESQRLGKRLGAYVLPRGVTDRHSLAQRKWSLDDLKHPYNGSVEEIRMRYGASTAFAQMIHEKCDLFDLLRLSVKRNLETYLRNTCGISSLEETFQAWLKH